MQVISRFFFIRPNQVNHHLGHINEFLYQTKSGQSLCRSYLRVFVSDQIRPIIMQVISSFFLSDQIRPIIIQVISMSFCIRPNQANHYLGHINEFLYQTKSGQSLCRSFQGFFLSDQIRSIIIQVISMSFCIRPNQANHYVDLIQEFLYQTKSGQSLCRSHQGVFLSDQIRPIIM